MIEVKHIWFSYEQWGEFVLKDISFSVEKGEDCRGSGREWCRQDNLTESSGRAFAAPTEREGARSAVSGSMANQYGNVMQKLHSSAKRHLSEGFNPKGIWCISGGLLPLL